MIQEWVDESFRALASKRLVASMHCGEDDGMQQVKDENEERRTKKKIKSKIESSHLEDFLL